MRRSRWGAWPWMLALVAGLLGTPVARAAQSPQIPLKGSTIPKFVDPLPPLEVITAGAGTIELHMREFQAQVLPTGMPATMVWGYLEGSQPKRATYIGPVIVATRDVPTEVKFVNDLGTTATTKLQAYLYSSDRTLHWADPLMSGMNHCSHMVMPPLPGSECAQNYAGPIPAVPHLHGGMVPPQVDGGPEAWVTSDGDRKGSRFHSRDGVAATNHMIYRYPNTQEGAPLWFHDHTLGATRIGVYGGLAGAYLLTDPANDPANLPPMTPLVIQDRMFDTAGQLFFPGDSAGGVLYALNPEHPYWVPEFVGDVIVVNGKAWPYLAVEPRRYTFLVLNGSNARTYELSLNGSVKNREMWIVGTDGGYLDAPQPAKKLVVMPGERYLVIVDFAGARPGASIVMNNTAKTPYPGGTPPQGSSTGVVMEFRVGALTAVDTSFNPATPGATLRGGAGQGPSLVRLSNPLTGTLAAGVSVTPQKTRQLTLNEILGPAQLAVNPVTGVLTSYAGGPLQVLVNNTTWDGLRAHGATAGGMLTFEPRTDFTPDAQGAYLSEVPEEGTTEVWEIVNLTADAHPIHLHLVQFQLLNRQSFDVKAYAAAYAGAFPGGSWDRLLGAPYPPGVFIPGFGPPLDYATGNPMALGGNPDIAGIAANGKPRFLNGAPTPPGAAESGWKDTVMVPPGQVTRFVVRWAPTDLPVSPAAVAGAFPFDPNGGDGYVWHCHIIDHEDNEMMRPTMVTPAASASRSFVLGLDY